MSSGAGSQQWLQTPEPPLLLTIVIWHLKKLLFCTQMFEYVPNFSPSVISNRQLTIRQRPFLYLHSNQRSQLNKRGTCHENSYWYSVFVVFQ